MISIVFSLNLLKAYRNEDGRLGIENEYEHIRTLHRRMADENNKVRIYLNCKGSLQYTKFNINKN